MWNLLPVLLFLSATAQAADLGGRFKLDAIGYDAGADTTESMLGYKTSSELAGQLRVTLNQQWSEEWKAQVSWQLDARHGSAVKRDQALVEAYPMLVGDSTDTSFWDLERTITDSDGNDASQRLDRLNLSYSSNTWVARLGRQALTWGSGLVFHPMDLVNPFQPVATDTAYKRGTDMAYLQWLLTDGSDIQWVHVPHKARDSGDPDGDKATQAVFVNFVGETFQWNLLLAKDRADRVLGAGASGSWGGAVWNLELIPSYLEQHTTRTSGLLNLSYASVLMGRNITAFVEYFRNGFGESDDEYCLTDLNAELLLRMQRGQRFVTGRDYLSAGATLEWTPLLQLQPTLILNARDHSGLVDLQLSRSLGNDTNLKAGLRLAIGGRGSEFGGLEVEPGSGRYLARSDQVFLRMETYF
jgi:hypothetical protein